MAATQSFTGRFGRAQVNAVEIGITKWTMKARKEFADATDSNNFDATTGQLWTSQDPGAVGFDGSVEGNYDAAGTTDTNFIQKFKSDGPFPVSLFYTRTVLAMTANCDFSDVDVTVSVPGSTMVTFTANFKTNGVPTSLP